MVPLSPLSQGYPIFTLPTYTNSLPLLLHGVMKPPLPPRPGQRAPLQTSSSRLFFLCIPLWQIPHSHGTYANPVPQHRARA